MEKYCKLWSAKYSIKKKMSYATEMCTDVHWEYEQVLFSQQVSNAHKIQSNTYICCSTFLAPRHTMQTVFFFVIYSTKVYSISDRSQSAAVGSSAKWQWDGPQHPQANDRVSKGPNLGRDAIMGNKMADTQTTLSALWSPKVSATFLELNANVCRERIQLSLSLCGKYEDSVM